MERLTRYTRNLPAYLVGLLVLIGLYVASQYNYLLFHSLAELFSIIVAYSIFILAWNTRKITDNGYLLFIGIAFLFIGSMDVVHTLAYKGMGVIQGADANLPTQLWIGARYLEAASLLIAPLFLKRKVPIGWVLAIFTMVEAFLLLSIFWWNIFPTCYIEGIGLTPFKKVSEYIIALMMAAAIGLLWKNKAEFDRDVLRLLIASLVAGILAEISFTEYVSVYGFANLMGHYLKILSFYWIYRAIIVTCLVQPYNFLFRNLKHSEEALRRAHDELELRVQERTAELRQANLELVNEIAERKRAEAELREYRTHLEDLVQARTAELRDFAFIASHDLREPLRRIQAFGQRLKKQIGQMDPTSADYLERMIRSADRLQEMISGLLDYSRVTTHARPFEQVDLAQVAREVISDLEVRIEEEHAQVTVEDLPVVEADPLQMRQLLQNLISNALKFHPSGVPPVVSVRSRVIQDDGTSENCAEISVEDQGVGFDERFLDRLFQPFQRLHTQSEFQGNGIGLPTCRKIVERHNGRLAARSTLGKGATFTVTLPVKQTLPKAE